ncbi:hypothetical protein FRC04_005231 [Tulasnella sp. 424]|nr:hypothetical protein FRC04_005231 [Tulasnella sp. 424]KAG8961685.1 hypothetical protein FRC05_005830 [Tulasnella sp. 425]
MFAQTSTNPPPAEADPVEDGDDLKAKKASKDKKAWKSMVKTTWKVVRPVVAVLAVVGSIVRDVIDFFDDSLERQHPRLTRCSPDLVEPNTLTIGDLVYLVALKMAGPKWNSARARES